MAAKKKSGNKITQILGGRKMCLIMLAMILISLKSVLGFDDETVKTILYCALGGAGSLAIEDTARQLKG